MHYVCMHACMQLYMYVVQPMHTCGLYTHVHVITYGLAYSHMYSRMHMHMCM